MKTTLHLSSETPLTDLRDSLPGDVEMISIQIEAGGEPEVGFVGALEIADAAIVDGVAFRREWIEAAPRLVAIAHAGAGSGGADLAAARAAGVYVTSAPDCATEAYADAILSAAPELGGWSVTDGALRPARENRPLRVGLIGFGSVGRAVARRMRALGARLWAVDPFIQPEILRQLGAREAPLDDLLGSCDLISISVPRCEATMRLIDARAIALMRRSAVLVSASWWETVDLEALSVALALGRLRGAALGALPEGSPVGLTSLLAAVSRHGFLKTLDLDFMKTPEVRRRAVGSALGAALKCLRGEPPDHLLIDPPFPRALEPAGF